MHIAGYAEPVSLNSYVESGNDMDVETLAPGARVPIFQTLLIKSPVLSGVPDIIWRNNFTSYAGWGPLLLIITVVYVGAFGSYGPNVSTISEHESFGERGIQHFSWPIFMIKKINLNVCGIYMYRMQMWMLVPALVLAAAYVYKYHNAAIPPQHSILSSAVTVAACAPYFGWDAMTSAILLQTYADFLLAVDTNGVHTFFPVMLFALSHMEMQIAFLMYSSAWWQILLWLLSLACFGVLIHAVHGVVHLGYRSYESYIIDAYAVILACTAINIVQSSGELLPMALFLLADAVILVDMAVKIPYRVILVPILYWSSQFLLMQSWSQLN